jgi:drug/metabolite transporter (DMT)-like permease
MCLPARRDSFGLDRCGSFLTAPYALGEIGSMAMQLLRYVLAAGVVLCVIGLIVAVPGGEREIGRSLFMAGFFCGAVSAVAEMFVAGGRKFGKMATPLKICAVGFGLGLISVLAQVVRGDSGRITDAFFNAGVVVMAIGIGLGAIAVGGRR